MDRCYECRAEIEILTNCITKASPWEVPDGARMFLEMCPGAARATVPPPRGEAADNRIPAFCFHSFFVQYLAV